jgi:F-type H+-transporting ATPase subunit b
MFPLLIASAAPAVHTAEGTEGAAQLLEQFGIEPVFLIMQLISFGILAFVLYRYMIKPILATVDERQRKISSGLQYADEMTAKLAATQQQNEAALREAQHKAQAIVGEAQKSAKEFADKQQKDAIEQATALISKAQQAIELEKKKMLAEARTEIARLVVATTQRVLAKELSDAERSRYNDAAARELTGV